MIVIQDWIESYGHTTRYWLGVLFFVLILSGLTMGGVQLFLRLSSTQLTPMSEMLISGERHYIDDLDLQQTLKLLPQADNFFSMDVDKVQQALIAMPWVKQVSVRKQWPNKLRIYLDEQQVAARWNQTALLNDDGSIFEASQHKIEATLVELSGPDDLAVLSLDYYYQLSALFTGTDLTVTKLTVSQRHSWEATLGHQVVLKLGRHDMVKRAERFAKLLGQLDLALIDYVDLRYDTGFAVGWNTQEG